jgi:hypothetical protein
MMNNNYRQQAPASLTFASPLAKLNSVNLDQELLQCFYASKVHMHSNKNSQGEGSGYICGKKLNGEKTKEKNNKGGLECGRLPPYLT